MDNDEPEYECSECGKEVLAQDKVCGNCGASLEDSDVPSVQAPQPQLITATDHPIDLPPFESAASRVKLVTAFLIISIALDIVSLFSTYAQIELISDVKHGQTITTEAADTNDSRQQAIGALQVLVYIFTGLFFLMWIHRAYKNLSALGATGLKYSTGWAVGGFFVPFLNLVRPFQVVTEIWKGSDPSSPGGAAWETSPSSPTIAQWWSGYLASAAIGWLSFNYARGATTIDSLINVSWVLFVADVVSVIAALLAIRMITAINSRQEAKYISLMQGGRTR